MKKEVVLIDGSNNHACCKALGFNLDYAKLLKLFPDLFRAYYFTALPPSSMESSVRPMVDYLSYNGYSVIQKEAKVYHNEGALKPKVKGNMDCELILTAVDMVEYMTDLHLFAGDGDFSAMVAWVKLRGVRVTVWSSIKTNPPMISDNLRREADYFIDLADVRGQIEQGSTETVKIRWRK